MRLIDADALERGCSRLPCVIDDEGLVFMRMKAVINCINNAPTVEAEPVRHGRWIPLRYDGYADGCPIYDEWECSECQYGCEGEGEPTLNYCPYCGAKMDGGGKNE